MWLALAVFIGVVGLIYGLYWLLVVRDEEAVIQRLTPGEKTVTTKRLRGVLKKEQKLSAVAPIHAALEKASAVNALRMLLEQSGVGLNVASFLLLSACLGLIGYLAGMLGTRMMLVGLIVGLVFGALPYFYVNRAKNKRILKFEEQFPEAIDLIARALRAGHALPTGLSMVADELAAPVGTEFRILYDQQNFGLNLSDAMRNFAARIPVLDAKFFVTAVLTQREAGGNLAEVLDNLSAVIRERFKVKRQIRVISAHGRITGVVLAALPPSLAAVTLLINRSYLGTLTGDPLGRQMILAALVLQIVGTLIMRKIIKIEY
jgi:tight adherence protein B